MWASSIYKKMTKALSIFAMLRATERRRPNIVSRWFGIVGDLGLYRTTSTTRRYVRLCNCRVTITVRRRKSKFIHRVRNPAASAKKWASILEGGGG